MGTNSTSMSQTLKNLLSNLLPTQNTETLQEKQAKFDKEFAELQNLNKKKLEEQRAAAADIEHKLREDTKIEIERQEALARQRAYELAVQFSRKEDVNRYHRRQNGNTDRRLKYGESEDNSVYSDSYITEVVD